NPMTQYIKDKLNVVCNTIWETEETEFPNRMALMIAGNSLPDTFTLAPTDYLLFRQLMDNNMLEPMDEAYETYANDYIKGTLATYNGLNRGEDGKLYAIAGGRYGYQHNQLWFRNDWLNAVNMEAPKTIADIEAILTAWKENPPTESYSGMMLNALSVGGVYDSFSASPIFAVKNAYPGMWLTDKDGNAVWGSVQPAVKDGLAVLADWYAKGLINPQFATYTAAGTKEAQVVGGTTGLFFAPWHIGYSISDFNATNPDAVLDCVNAPLSADGKYNIAFPGSAGSFICVRKGFEHPEAVVKVMNCEYDMWRGLDEKAAELIQPTRDNGADWAYLLPTSKFNVEPSTCVPDSGAIAKALVEGTDYSDLAYNPQTLLMAEQAVAYAKQGNSAPAGSWLSYITRYVGANPTKMYGDEIQHVYPAFSFVTESMADIKPNLDTLEQTTFLKIITGELPIDAFDQFVADWYAQGGQLMTDEVSSIIK
ncbi:MAG: hypothetical protein RSC68_22680, partial [Acinetobacter sp.]